MAITDGVQVWNGNDIHSQNEVLVAMLASSKISLIRDIV